MAKSVQFTPHVHDAQEILQRRLEDAPKKHADALVDALQTLQTLHDTGTLEFVRGLFGAGDEVIAQVVDVATSPQSTRALRNLLILMNVLGSVDPDALEQIAKVVTAAVADRQAPRPPSLLRIARRAFSANARRALWLGLGVVVAIGGAGHRARARK